MNKDELLKLIATSGYNVYFGAKNHFATYDIIEKVPRAIALLGLLIGIWQLWKPDISYSQLIAGRVGKGQIRMMQNDNGLLRFDDSQSTYLLKKKKNLEKGGRSPRSRI
ncbi:hypothetical protein MHB84_27645 [Paenibacillus sp. FSL F4-0087]|uniref:hypothetical protein n=1 Tax=Paenibacillus sp. FSL F4-0087 TaxID=2921368 RepID=UPI00096F1E84|nr:hypothetical protein BK122_09705 [Paenibacillus pabuli]